MNQIIWCMWVRMDYPDRHCNQRALADDDLCHTHRSHVDSLIHRFEESFGYYAAAYRRWAT